MNKEEALIYIYSLDKKTLDNLIKYLSPRRKEVILFFINPEQKIKTYRAAAKFIGISASRVGQLLNCATYQMKRKQRILERRKELAKWGITLSGRN